MIEHLLSMLMFSVLGLITSTAKKVTIYQKTYTLRLFMEPFEVERSINRHQDRAFSPDSDIDCSMHCTAVIIL